MEYSVLWLIFQCPDKEEWSKLCLLDRDIWYGHIFSKWVNVEKVSHLKFKKIHEILSRSELKLFLKNHWESHYFRELCKYGDLKTLKWAKKYLNIAELSVPGQVYIAFELAAENGHVGVLKWLVPQCDFTRNDSVGFAVHIWSLLYAAENGRLEVVRWLIEKFNYTKTEIIYYSSPPAFLRAVKHGHLEVLKYFHERVNLTKADVLDGNHNTLGSIAYYGQLEILKWLTNQFNLTKEDVTRPHNTVFPNAATRGHLEMLKWVTERFNITREDVHDIDDVLYNAANNQHIEVFEWLIEQFDAYDRRDIWLDYHCTMLSRGL